MSKIIEPEILPSNQSNFVMKDSQGNIVETKQTSGWNSQIKDLNKLFNTGTILPLFQVNQGQPYVFLKDFSFKKQIFGGGSPSDLSIGAKLITENYKKDQVVYPFPSAPNVRMKPNPAFTKAIDEGVLVEQNIVAKVNEADNISEKYRVNKDTKIYRINPNKEPQGIEVVGTDIVGNLKNREIITVVRKGLGGRGAVPTLFLYLKDDTYIYGGDADLLSEDEVSKIERNKNLTTIALLALVGLVAYKLIRK